MLNIEELRNKIAFSLNKVSLDGEPKGLYEPISYTIEQKGKRIRPVMVLLSTQLFGGNPDEAIPAATAIELFHNFTLLHDDIIDKAPLRRGYQTVYKKWNTNIAILSGDTMFAIAYGELAKSKPTMLPHLMEVFTHTAIQVCEGQQYDIDFEELENVTLSDYIKMIRLKTAVLLAASLKIGAIVANASDEDAEKIYNFGINLGIAFQLQDDLLDSYGDQSVFGKKTGGDIAVNKKTVLYIKAIEKADALTLLRLNELYTNKQLPVKEKIKQVLQIFEKLGVKATTEELIASYFNTALSIFESINISEEQKRMMLDLANSMMHRDH